MLQDILKLQRRITENNWEILHKTYKKPGTTCVAKSHANTKYYAQSKFDLIKIFKLVIRDQDLVLDPALIALGLIEDPVSLQKFLMALGVGIFGTECTLRTMQTDCPKAFLDEGLLMIKADYEDLMEAINHVHSMFANTSVTINATLDRFTYENFFDAAAALTVQNIETKRWGHKILQALLSMMTGHQIQNERINTMKLLSNKHHAARHLGKFLSAIFSFDDCPKNWLPFGEDEFCAVKPAHLIKVDRPLTLPNRPDYAPNDCFPVGEPTDIDFSLDKDKMHKLLKQIMRSMARDRQVENNARDKFFKDFQAQPNLSTEKRMETATIHTKPVPVKRSKQVMFPVIEIKNPMAAISLSSPPKASSRPSSPGDGISTVPLEPRTPQNEERASWMADTMFYSYVSIMLDKYFSLESSSKGVPMVVFHEHDNTDETALDPDLHYLDIMRYNNVEIANIRIPVQKDSIFSNMLKNNTILKWLDTMNRIVDMDDTTLPTILSEQGPAVLPLATPVDEEQFPRKIFKQPPVIRFQIDGELYRHDDRIFRFPKEVAIFLDRTRNGREVWMSIAVATRKVYEQVSTEKISMGPPLEKSAAASKSFLTEYGRHANNVYSLGDIRSLLWQQATSIIWNGDHLEHDCYNRANTMTARQIVKAERAKNITYLNATGMTPAFDRAFRTSFLNSISCSHCESTPATIIIDNNVQYGIVARCDTCGLHTLVKTHHRACSRQMIETLI